MYETGIEKVVLEFRHGYSFYEIRLNIVKKRGFITGYPNLSNVHRRGVHGGG